MRNLKRFFSIFIVIAIVTAMAVACGSKQDEAKKPDDAAEEQAEEKKDDAAEEQADAEVEEPETNSDDETITEADVEAAKASIKEAVIEEYLKPNGIAAEDFVWPDVNMVLWDYYYQLRTQYQIEQFSGKDYEIDPNVIPAEPEKQLLDSTFNGLITWYEGAKEGSLKSFANTGLALDIDVITTIDLTAE